MHGPENVQPVGQRDQLHEGARSHAESESESDDQLQRDTLVSFGDGRLMTETAGLSLRKEQICFLAGWSGPSGWPGDKLQYTALQRMQS
jgi:hypothetical protein